MTKGPVYFEIQADDPARAIDFYTAVFGWMFSEVKGLPVSMARASTGLSLYASHGTANIMVRKFEA